MVHESCASSIASLLSDPSLYKTQGLINGKWVDANETFEVTNPATNEVIAKVQDLDAEYAERAITAAQESFMKWRNVCCDERCAILEKYVKLLQDNMEDIVLLLSMENGKNLNDSRFEVQFTIDNVRWYCEEARRVQGEFIPGKTPDGTTYLVTKMPIGPIAALVPWNYPLFLGVRKFIGAASAGCTAVVKPSSQTPLSTAAMMELASRAGFPAGVFNFVPCSKKNRDSVGRVLTSSPLIKMVSFTGSCKVGKELYKQCAPTVKKITLELGGNSPFIVFDDADVDAAAMGGCALKMMNCGQVCVNANRFFVHEKVYDAFVQKFVEAASQLKVGKYNDEGAPMGPLIDEKAVKRMEGLIADAVEKGAKVALGGARHALGGNFFQPTVLLGTTSEMRVYKEEIFGPIACIYKFSSEEEAISRANDVSFGLAAYFYSKNMSRVLRVNSALEAGNIGINTPMFLSNYIPFGGVKESGVGREAGRNCIEEFLETKSSALMC
eukprot:Nk52_evm8s1271 gene=Nk52_evmTU8s1271